MSDITVHKPKAVWEAKNPVLPNGTFGFEEESGKVKLGDGIKRWLTLPYQDVPPYTLPPFPDVEDVLAETVRRVHRTSSGWPVRPQVPAGMVEWVGDGVPPQIGDGDTLVNL